MDQSAAGSTRPLSPLCTPAVRFSRNAEIPSRKSLLREQRIWLRSSMAMTCSRLPASMLALRHSLVRRRPSGELRSMSAASASAAFFSFAVGDDARDQAQALGTRRVDEVAGEKELGGDRRADHPRQEVAHPDVAGGEPDANEGGVHARALAGDSYVGAERQREAAAAGRAVHAGDDRLRGAPHEHHQLADPALRPQARLNRAEAAAIACPLLEIEPGAEGTAGAGEHDDARLAVVAERGEEVAQLVDQRAVHGVQRLGAVQRQTGDVILALDEQSLVGHCLPPEAVSGRLAATVLKGKRAKAVTHRASKPSPAADGAREFVFRGEAMRLDQAIAASLSDVSRGQARRLIGAGSVFVEGRRCRIASRLVRGGERVRVGAAEPPHVTSLRILYEDEDVIAIDKPPGMPTAPTRQAAAGTAYEALRDELRRRGGATRLWVVHRLDAATSGVVAFARNAAAARALSRAFQDHLVDKRYVALVNDAPSDDEGRIDAAIEVAGGRATVSEGGKPASTSWRVRARGEHDAVLELAPRTGRMHQLRVHLAALGHPIVGDRLYGGSAAPRLMLHAERLIFPHPRRGESIEVAAAPPAEIRCGASAPPGAKRSAAAFVRTSVRRHDPVKRQIAERARHVGERDAFLLDPPGDDLQRHADERLRPDALRRRRERRRCACRRRGSP